MKAISLFGSKPVPSRASAARAPLRAWRQRGSSVVEMALIAPVLMLLMVGIVEMSLVFFTTLTMQYAVREGARYGVTGRTDKDPNAASQQRYLAIIQRIKESSAGMYDRVNPKFTVNNKSYASAANYSAGMFGGAGEIVVIELECDWPLATPMLAAFFANGKYHFTVAATMLNEEYDS